MKKIVSSIVIIMMAIVMVSCGNRTKKVDTVNEVADTTEVVADSTTVAVDSTVVE